MIRKFDVISLIVGTDKVQKIVESLQTVNPFSAMFFEENL